MPFEYLEHQADVGIKAVGESVEEALAEGARAMFNVMVDIEKVSKDKEVEIECEASDFETLFVEMLNELLYQREINEMIFGDFEVTGLKKEGQNLKLKGKAFGEKLDLAHHQLKTEVKAATYAGLKYYQEENQHIFQCLLDV